MTTSPTVEQMLGELRLTAIERADHIEILVRGGKRLPEEIGIKRIRLELFRSAIADYERLLGDCGEGGKHWRAKDG